MHKKSAFTLIELLVVIAIIAMLSAIIVPASMKGIEMARRSACANNLKALGIGYLSYAADHGGNLPHFNSPLGLNFEETKFFSLIAVNVYTNGYITDLRLYVCPSDKIDQGHAVKAATDIASFNSDQGNCSYLYVSGYNLLSSPESPGLVPLFCDEANEEEHGIGQQIGDMPPLGPEDNHGADVRNVLYLDGRVVTLKDADAANSIFQNFVDPRFINATD